MPSWTRGLFATLSAAGLAASLVLSAGTAAADPDPAPGDPNVAAPADPPRRAHEVGEEPPVVFGVLNAQPFRRFEDRRRASPIYRSVSSSFSYSR